MRLHRLLPACTLALAVPPAPAGLPIVDRAIETHGGSRFTSSRTSFEVCSKSGCSRVSAEVDGGLFVYEARSVVAGIDRRVRTTNDSVELWEDGSAVRVTTPEEAQRLRDWVMQRVYFNFLPFRLNDASVLQFDVGEEDWMGRRLHKVKIGFEPGSSTDAQDEYLFWFDPGTARLELFAYSYVVNGGGLRFRRLFDHRRIGGMLFYDQENWGVEGEELTVDLVTPDFVTTRMRRVSTITLRDIDVQPLPAP